MTSVHNPSDEFHGRVPVDVILSIVLALFIAANITITVKCKVYNNLNSLTIICAMTLI